MKTTLKKPANAIVLRQSPSGIDRLMAISLKKNVIINGWSVAKGLIEEKDWWKFREIMRKTCYPNEKTFRKAGYAASTMQRFINGIQIGDWVVVPHIGGVFYVAEVTSDAFYDSSKAATDTDSCYRRKVKWLNGGQPIPRSFAKAKLASRMKTQQTSAEAGDLVDLIYQAVLLASRGKSGAKGGDLFSEGLRNTLKAAVLDELHNGHMTPQKLEKFVMKVLLGNGASKVRHIHTTKDQGVDLVATFLVGGITQVDVGVQVKCHEGKTLNHLLDQLCTGLEKENLTHGWFVSTAAFEPNAQKYLEKQLFEKGIHISLVDGDQLADMVIEQGLEKMDL